MKVKNPADGADPHRLSGAGRLRCVPSAIHHASTVLFKNVAAMRSGDWKEKNAYTYGLHGTPTTFTLEARLAEIEGGTHCLLAPSGWRRLHGGLRAAQVRRRCAVAG
jgi:cystathionine beta-lyase/cystathionine gamma-synthase